MTTTNHPKLTPLNHDTLYKRPTFCDATYFHSWDGLFRSKMFSLKLGNQGALFHHVHFGLSYYLLALLKVGAKTRKFLKEIESMPLLLYRKQWPQ